MKKSRLVFFTWLVALLAFSLFFGCSNDDNSSGPARGIFTINTSGGAGTNGSGGDGDYIEIYIDYGSGGDIKIMNNGRAVAKWSFPRGIVTYLGPNPLNITTNLTIDVAAVEPAAGTPYLVAGDSHIYISDGNAVLQDEDPVTGVSVAAGVTLTLGLQDPVDQTAKVFVENDFQNAGTLTAAMQPGDMDRGNLRIDCDVFYGTQGSMIDLTGAEAVAMRADGGDGGYFSLDADDNNWDTTEDEGGVFNQGMIDTSGGDGDNGGDAGYIYIWSELAAYNTGNMYALGGDGSNGAGGDGDSIEIETDYGNNFNTGNLDASGGDGTTDGGDAGFIYLYIAYPGDIRNTGDLTSNGGDAGTGSGGDGDYIEFYLYGGGIFNTGNCISLGGDSTGGQGGDGGYLDVEYSEDSGWWGDYQPAKNFEFSGDIDLRGGDGTDGGDGGYVYFDLDADYIPMGQEILLYGYTDLITNGGDGTTHGGDAGYIDLFNEYQDADIGDYGPSGGIYNYADVQAMGGDGASGSGGDGNYFQMYTEDEYGYFTDKEVVKNYGDLNLSGGDGTTDGGDAGGVFLWGYNGAENYGDIRAVGGSASADGGSGGDAANEYSEHQEGVYILADLGPAINKGTITCEGGDAPGDNGTGGDGALIEIVGYSAQNTGNLSTHGGDAGLTGGMGGDADAVFLYGIFEGCANSARTIDVSPGAGATPGDNGEVFVDGVNETDDWYTP